MPVVTSGEAKVRAASHLSNFPAIATEAFTEKVTELSSCVITMVGPCARLSVVKIAEAARLRRKNFIVLGSVSHIPVRCQIRTSVHSKGFRENIVLGDKPSLPF